MLDYMQFAGGEEYPGHYLVDDVVTREIFFGSSKTSSVYEITCVCGDGVLLGNWQVSKHCQCGAQAHKVIDADTDELLFMVTFRASGIVHIVKNPKAKVHGQNDEE